MEWYWGLLLAWATFCLVISGFTDNQESDLDNVSWYVDCPRIIRILLCSILIFTWAPILLIASPLIMRNKKKRLDKIVEAVERQRQKQQTLKQYFENTDSKLN